MIATTVSITAFSIFAGIEWEMEIEGKTSKYAVTTRCHNTGTSPVNVTIPSEWDVDGVKYPVRVIGRSTFWEDSFLSVSIPDSITEIGSSAFGSCHKITSIVIPNSVTNIDDYAFSYCDNLKTITLGQGVRRIGQWAFERAALTSITIPDSVVIIDESAFASCKSLTSVTFGHSLKTIGPNAFQLCDELSSISIPDNVTTLSDGAFFYCIGLKSATIGRSIKTIGENAFNNCSELTEVEIGDAVKTIKDGVFSYCRKLTKIKFYGNKPTVETGTFGAVTASVLYPADAIGWTSNRSDWGSAYELTFIPYDSNTPTSIAELNSQIVQAKDGDKIMLSAGGLFADANEIIEIPNGKHITLDLNGKVIDCKQLLVSGGLTITDNVGTGSIKGIPTIGTNGNLSVWPLQQSIVTAKPSGGITPAIAEDVKITNSQLNITVTVEQTDSLDKPNWQPVPDVSATLTIPVNGKQGFYRMQSKGN